MWYPHPLYTWLLGIRAGEVETETTELEIEAAARQSEDARRLGDVAAGAFEFGRDQLPLDFLDRGRQALGRSQASRAGHRRGGAGGRRGEVWREVIGLDGAARRAHRDRALNLVAQLADIARPPVAREQV